MSDVLKCPVCQREGTVENDPYLHDCCCGHCGPYCKKGWQQCNWCGALWEAQELEVYRKESEG